MTRTKAQAIEAPMPGDRWETPFSYPYHFLTVIGIDGGEVIGRYEDATKTWIDLDSFRVRSAGATFLGGIK